METAEKQVTDVVKCDIHLDYTADGKRYIDRISEIIQLEEGIPYPEYDPENKEDSMNMITAEYYSRKTDRVSFRTQLIMHYDLSTHTYVADNRFSEYLENRLRDNLVPELQVAFDEFMLREWGPRKTEDGQSVHTQVEIDKQLEEYKVKLDEIDAHYKEQEERDRKQAEEMARLEAENSGTFENEAALNRMWATGYTPDGEEIEAPEFSLGTFFDDDDYS